MPDEIPKPDFPGDRPDESPVEEELTLSDHPADDVALRAAAITGAGGGAAGIATGGLVGQGAAYGVMQEAAGGPDADETPPDDVEEPGEEPS
jgi:hypothetical protein